MAGSSRSDSDNLPQVQRRPNVAKCATRVVPHRERADVRRDRLVANLRAVTNFELHSQARTGETMEQHKIVSQAEWIETRKAHLRKEKEFTRLRDQLSAERRKLP